MMGTSLDGQQITNWLAQVLSFSRSLIVFRQVASWIQNYIDIQLLVKKKAGEGGANFCSRKMGGATEKTQKVRPETMKEM